MVTMTQFLNRALNEKHGMVFDFPVIKTKVKEMKGDKSKIEKFKKEVMGNPGFKKLEKKSQNFLMGLFDNALKEDTEISEINEIVSPQMHKTLKNLGVTMNAVRNQLRMDGYDKEADKIFMKFNDIISEINKLYK